MWGIITDRQIELPIWRQIYQSIRDRITTGMLKAGEILPSTRELSKELDVSRSTVCEAYEMLIAEGYVISRQGSPTRVAEGLCMEMKPGSVLLNTESIMNKNTSIQPAIYADFKTGRPDLSHFPRFLWQQLLQKAYMELPMEQYGYTGPKGNPSLCSEISSWLFRSRGLMVDPSDIFVTAGATHALHLVAELLCTEGRGVLVEDPCHSGMLQTFLNKGCPVIPVPVDEHGLQTDHLKNGEKACAVYVTPSHQFPLGGILPAARRTALIRYAKENGIYIIEDDYDSEFRFCGEPVAPLIALDPQCVIYVGTFSKVLFPGLRIGYVILPVTLQKRWRDIRTHVDVQNPPFEQAVLAEFLGTRKFDRYVQKMRRIYGERRKVLLESLSDNFGEDWTAFGDSAGLHAAIKFTGRQFDDTFRKTCLQNGIDITPVEKHCIRKGRHMDKLLLGYGHMEPEKIKTAVAMLHDFMNKPQ